MAADRALTGRRLLAVAEEDFQRVVLDVHDGPVQNIFAALSQLALARARLPRDAKGAASDALAAEPLDRASALLERALEEIRLTLTAFRPPSSGGGGSPSSSRSASSSTRRWAAAPSRSTSSARSPTSRRSPRSPSTACSRRR